MKNFFIKIGCYIACNLWWPIWSTIRWKKYSDDVDVKSTDKVHTLEDIIALVKRLYKSFNYKMDGVDELFDSVCPPPYNYKRYLVNELRDDCDGFHTLVYHCLRKSGIQCYLLSVIALGGSHCVLLFKYDNKWYVDDYNSIRKIAASADPQEAIDKYNEYYVSAYSTKSEVLYNALIEWNYDAKTFVSVSISSLKA